MSLLEPEGKEALPISTKWRAIRILFVLMVVGSWFLLFLTIIEALRSTDFPVGVMLLWLLIVPLSFLLGVIGTILHRIEKRQDSSKFWWIATLFAAGPLCVGILLTMLN